MDVDYYFSSSAEAHEDLAAVVMEMEKYPEFFSSEADPSPETSLLDFSLLGAPQPPFCGTPPASGNSHQSTLWFHGAASGDAGAVSPVVYADHLAAAAGMPVSAEPYGGLHHLLGPKQASVAAMREMIFRIAAMQPIHIDPESVKPPKRRNVRISKDPQSVAARHRRERISERIRILQRLVPGGTRMDTASMLDEAIHYVKFLKTQVQSLERAAGNRNTAGVLTSAAAPGPAAAAPTGGNYACLGGYEPPEQQFANHSWMLS